MKEGASPFFTIKYSNSIHLKKNYKILNGFKLNPYTNKGLNNMSRYKDFFEKNKPTTPCLIMDISQAKKNLINLQSLSPCAKNLLRG